MVMLGEGRHKWEHRSRQKSLESMVLPLSDGAGHPDEQHPDGSGWAAIAARHAPGGLICWPRPGRYTDDTQMTLALAQSLVHTPPLPPPPPLLIQPAPCHPCARMGFNIC